MSGSVREVQDLADQILALLDVRIRSGELVVRYADGLVQKCETRTVHRPTAAKRAASRYRVTGEWGSLQATNGVLVSADGKTLAVPAPNRVDGTPLAGEGWALTLASGCVARPEPRSGDYQVVRESR